MRKENFCWIWFTVVLVFISAACTAPPEETPIPLPTETSPAATSTSTPDPTPTQTATPPPTLDPCENETRYDGWMYHEYCIPGVIAEEFWLSPNPNHFIGLATYYGDGVMEKVAERRGLSLNNVWGGVALMNCGDVGSHVYLKRSPQFEFEGPYLVVDCSKKEHLYYNVMINGLAVEVDYQTSRRWGMSGGLPFVHVCKTYPNCGAAGTLKSWFARNVIWDAEEVPTNVPLP